MKNGAEFTARAREKTQNACRAGPVVLISRFCTLISGFVPPSVPLTLAGCLLIFHRTMHERNGRAAGPARPRTPVWGQFVLPAAIGAAGALLVLVNTIRWGAGLSQDSAYYISAARNLLAGRGLTCFDGTPFVAWPPLFPLTLAGLGRLGIEPLAGAWLVNTLAFGVVVFLTGILLARSVRDRALVVIGTVAVMVSPAFFDTAITVLTEPVFALIIALLTLLLGRFSARGRMLDFLPIVALTALAPLQRYMGMTIIPAAALAILTARELPVRRRVACSVVLCLLSPLPIGLWLARNLRLSGTLTGERAGAFTALGPTALTLSRTILRWFLPERADQVLGAFSIVLVLAAAALTAWLVASAVRRRKGSGPAQVRFALVAVSVYVAALLFAGAGYGNFEHDRFMAPVFFLAVLLLAVAAERVIQASERRGRNKVSIRALVLAAGILLLVYPATQSVSVTRRGILTGRGGFSHESWKQNLVIRWLKANPISGRILSNEPAAVYFLTGAAARKCPRRDDDPVRLRQTGGVATGDHLVWFRSVYHPNLMVPEELDRQFGLDVITSNSDGGVAVFR